MKDVKKILNDKENKISRHYFTEICESDNLEEILESAYEHVTDDEEERPISKIIDEMIEHIRNKYPWTTSIEVTNEYLASVVFDATNEILPDKFYSDINEKSSCDFECRNPRWDFAIEVDEVKEKIKLMDIIHNYLPNYEEEEDEEEEDEEEEEIDDYDEYTAIQNIRREVSEALFDQFYTYIDISEAHTEEALLQEHETWRRLCREYIWEKSDINKKLNSIEKQHYRNLRDLLEEFRDIHIFFIEFMNPSNQEGSEYNKSQQWLEKFKKEIQEIQNTINIL